MNLFEYLKNVDLVSLNAFLGLLLLLDGTASLGSFFPAFGFFSAGAFSATVDFFSSSFFSAGFFSAFGTIGIKRENMKGEIGSDRSGGELMLKQQCEALIQENAILKRAVAIQHECQK